MTLEKIHMIQLELCLEIKRICEKHNIKYFMVAGTLLGAVRHKGFIPWDDDLDIGMKRIDYIEFLKVCEYELDSKYLIESFEDTLAVGIPLAKLRKRDTVYKEKNGINTNTEKGIFIDIFPFDNIPNNYIQKFFHDKSTYILKRLLIANLNYIVWEEDQKTKLFIYTILKWISKLVGPVKLKKLLSYLMTRYNAEKTDELVTFGGSYGYHRETIKADWIDKIKLIEFEKYKIPAPLEYKKYLSNLYGDYMTPPPENQRYNRHKIIEVEYEKKKEGEL